MRLLSLLPFTILITLVFGDDDLPPPGEAALPYTDGSFGEPNGGTASYDEGNKMNISWTTAYETSNLYLIVGYDWVQPVQLTTNTAQTWFEWDVTTDSTNSSEIYVFRVVNGTGTADQKAVGGFLSAAFYIHVKETETPTSTLSTITTAATEPAKTPTSSTTSTATSTSTPTITSAPSTGISEGGKIGVGVGVGVGVLGLGALAAAFVIWWKTKKRQNQSGPQPYEMPLNGDFSPHHQSSQPYDSNQIALAGYYKPTEVSETRGAELDAGQGHHFIPEANHDERIGRVELQ
ncbi:hypothetical protein F4777DRAFT_533004 [Nemania sp. FL0916]|nr:hypothetical protein F4777DRAFT_533004 [Nemania sp. FL0916]